MKAAMQIPPTHVRQSSGKPDVRSNTRVVVGFPFSTIHVQTDASVGRLAELLARLACELDRQHPSAEAAAIAHDAAAVSVAHEH